MEPKEKLNWGEHHSGKPGKVKDKDGKLITDTDELISGQRKPTDLSEEEPGRNRSGVREGESKLDRDA